MDGRSTTSDEVFALLRQRGGRVTAARRAVVEALLDGAEHLTADDVVEIVQASHPEVHRSTVYRTLDRLEQLGAVTHVHLGHGPSTFHLAHRPHHHAVCEVCGAVIEVPWDALDGLADQLRREHGFELSHQHFALSGRCAACVPGALPPRPEP
ncbi:MAG TPA: Fur family transcriptional regulator [Microthrixaceae bacterium]|nr:Fur family transcriptional regulator [Microthrixaceae bacterium]